MIVPKSFATTPDSYHRSPHPPLPFDEKILVGETQVSEKFHKHMMKAADDVQPTLFPLKEAPPVQPKRKTDIGDGTLPRSPHYSRKAKVDNARPSPNIDIPQGSGKSVPFDTES